MVLPRLFFYGNWSARPDCVYHALAQCLDFDSIDEFMKHLEGFCGDTHMPDFPTGSQGRSEQEILTLLQQARVDYQIFPVDLAPHTCSQDVFEKMGDLAYTVYDKWEEDQVSRLAAVLYTRSDGSGHCVNFSFAQTDPKLAFSDHQNPHHTSEQIWTDVQNSTVKFLVVTKKFPGDYMYGDRDEWKAAVAARQ